MFNISWRTVVIIVEPPGEPVTKKGFSSKKIGDEITPPPSFSRKLVEGAEDNTSFYRVIVQIKGSQIEISLMAQ